MKSSNIFLDSLKESFSSLMSHKRIFFLIFILQLVFISSFFFASISYQSRILNSLQSIGTYVAEQETSEIDITSDILEQRPVFGNDPQLLSRELESIRKVFRSYILVSFLIFVFFISLIFSLSNRMLWNKNFKKTFAKSSVISSFFLAVIFGIFYRITDSAFFSLSTQASSLTANYSFFAAASLVIYYFMFICLAILADNPLQKTLKKSFFLGFKKIHYILPSMIFTAVIILSVFYFGTAVLELMPVLGFILFIFGLKLAIFGRIFIISLIEKIGN